MTENPYQSPGDDDPPADRPIGLRSWQVPFIIAAICGTALAVLVYCVPHDIIFPDRGIGFFGLCFGLVGGVLVMDVFVCGLVVFEWWRTGSPPELTLEPLIPCAERRARYRAWKERPQLDDDAFYETFYADSGIAKEIVIGVRREFQAVLDRSLAGVRPSDDMSLADPELDAADLYDRLDKAFAISIPWRRGKLNIDDLTFNSLVRLVTNCKRGPKGQQVPAEL